jgi:hypothetical protein
MSHNQKKSNLMAEHASTELELLARTHGRIVLYKTHCGYSLKALQHLCVIKDIQRPVRMFNLEDHMSWTLPSTVGGHPSQDSEQLSSTIMQQFPGAHTVPHMFLWRDGQLINVGDSQAICKLSVIPK